MRVPHTTHPPPEHGRGRERRNAVPPNAYECLQSEIRYAGPSEHYLDYAAVDATISVGLDAAVALGSFDPEAFRERWTDDRSER